MGPCDSTFLSEDLELSWGDPLFCFIFSFDIRHPGFPSAGFDLVGVAVRALANGSFDEAGNVLYTEERG